MLDPLDISILIPTRNCAGLVPEHIESLNQWADLAREIVIVDSESRDGTVDLLRKGLSHPRVKFLNHPPGLYQSWNFGIQNVSAKYLYIATVGDSITRHGVEHLFRVAEEFQSNVAISKPRFVSEDGKALPDDRWPIDIMLARLNITQPRLLRTAEQFLFAVTNFWGAILGSSASNIYRSEFLKQRPFPTEFGTAGDAGWSILNIFDARIAITPDRFSTFRHHQKAYALSDYYVDSLAFKLFRLAQTVVARQQPGNPAVQRVLEEVQWTELEPALEIVPVQHAKLEACRKKLFPWFLNPAAWRARAARNQAERRINAIMDRLVAGSGTGTGRMDGSS
jgi:Glycosyl transferase family 2